jgi:hypothetical protein
MASAISGSAASPIRGSIPIGLEQTRIERSAIASTTPTESTAFSMLETLARYRPDITLYSELQEIAGENDFIPRGIVPLQWFDRRMIGSAEPEGTFAKIGDADWIARIRHTLAPLLLQLGIADFDASVRQESEFWILRWANPARRCRLRLRWRSLRRAGMDVRVG